MNQSGKRLQKNHAIGDRAVRVSVDALEAARRTHGDNGQPHGLAHAQVVHPDDQKRIGEMGLFIAFTHAWSTPEPEDMMSVAPFIDELKGGASDMFDGKVVFEQEPL